MDFPFHREASATVVSPVVKVFAALDDHKRLAGHMSKPSLMMAGTTMAIEIDQFEGKAVGSEIRLRGRVFGIPIFVVEKVVEYTAPFRKVWQTTTEPRLLLIGSYRMGFELMPQAQATVLRVWIDYALPSVFFPTLDRANSGWLLRAMVCESNGSGCSERDLMSIGVRRCRAEMCRRRNHACGLTYL